MRASALRKAADESAVARGSFRLLVLALYLLFIPAQVVLSVGDAQVFPYRPVFALGALWVLVNYLRRRIDFGRVDLIMLFVCIWPLISVSAVIGVSRAINSASSATLDMGVSYFLARTALRDLNDVRRFFIWMVPGFFVAGFLVFSEAATHHYVLQPMLKALMHSHHAYLTDNPSIMVRHGLLRGLGPWPHPILAGMVLASLLPFFILGRIRGWPRWAGLAASVFAVATVSSSAFLALGAQGILIFYDWVTRNFRQATWKLGLTAVFLYLGVMQFASNRGAVGFLMQFGAFNTSSSMYRRLIWRYGTASVEKHPVFGIAFQDWERLSWMPPTIDNYWLNLAMQMGLPMVTFALGAAVFTIFALGRRVGRTSGADRAMCLAFAVAISVFVLGAFSVSLWGQAQVWFFVLLGMGAWLARLPVTEVARDAKIRGPVRVTRSGKMLVQNRGVQ